MSVLQSWRQGGKSPLRPLPILGSLLAALAAGPAAHAVTSITVDGHPDPVTLTAGETVTVRFDVAKPGGLVNLAIPRDLAGTGIYDPSSPIATTNSWTDGGSEDLDPAPGKVAIAYHPLASRTPAGRYLFHIVDQSDRSTRDLPMTIAAKLEAQAISGRVAVVSSANPAGVVPPDAVIWAASDLQTLVASTSIRPDGSYTLPVPPGTYLLFAEWYGSLRSQRQVVTLAAGQPVPNVDLPLLQGQEVSGTVRADSGQPMADAMVQAADASGRTLTTRSFADGSYVLVLPDGTYTLAARGLAKRVTVAGVPVDLVDFPPPVPGPAPAVGTIVTVAGDGIRGFGGDGGPATAARVSSLQAVAVDRGGNFYMSDFALQRIRKVDAAGIVTTVAGAALPDDIRGLRTQESLGAFSGDGGPATAARLNAPSGMGVDAAGSLYFTDARNHRVRKIDPQGIITTVAGSGAVGTANGSFSGDGGPATSATLNTPIGLAIDATGTLYIADRNNGRVRKVTPSGIISTVAGGGKDPVSEGAQETAVALGSPAGVAVDRAGNLFIADRGLNRILKVSPAGVISLVAGTGKGGFSGDGGPATAADIAPNPGYLALDSAGNLYWGESINHRVRKVSPEGIITTVAGSGPYGPGVPGSFAGDGGPATAARLWNPFSVAIDQAGNLYFADAGNSRIRKVIGIAAPGLIAGQ